MSRRKGQAAKSAMQNEAFNRWRILLRQKKFQNNLNRLRSQYRKWVKGPPITQYTSELGDDPGGEFGPPTLRQAESKISRKDVDLYEHECDLNDPMVGGAGAWRAFDVHWGIRLPKAALSDALTDLRQDTINQWTAIFSNEPTIVPSPVKSGHAWQNWLRLEVNLSYPRDILIESIEQKLSQVMLQRRKARRRWDKFDYYLKVYDLGLKNETFAAIARTLKKRVSTVKSAYVSIARTILTFDPARLRRIQRCHDRAPKTKKQLALSNFDYRTHISECERCSSAITENELCPIVQLYIDQDSKGGQELPVPDVETSCALLKSRKPTFD